MDFKQCQCEHAAHFEENHLTPNGNPGHRAGVSFHLDRMAQVKTPWGTELVCDDCRRDCRKEFPNA